MSSRSTVLIILLIISIILNIYFVTQLFKFKKLYNNVVNSVQTKYEELGQKANNLKSYMKNTTNEGR